jgi:Acetyl xylan esterase (AXE1)
MPRAYFTRRTHANHQWLDQIKRQAEEHRLRHEAEKASLRTVAQWEARRDRLRRDFLAGLGGLPAEKSPLNVQVTGQIDRGAYRIEKLIYESMPGFPVTGLLYLPKNAPHPAPAVIFLCGHTIEAKGYGPYQQVAIELAQNGFVVLAYDPPGQGERMQYYLPETGENPVGSTTTEHCYEGFPCRLTGKPLARWFIWDGIRAVDLLASRPEVDAARIAITGNSGGGTQSTWIMTADDRIAAAMPCTFLSGRKWHLAHDMPADDEQNLSASITRGLDHDDLCQMFAPRPLAIGAVNYDFFPIEGVLEVYESAARIYDLYGARDNLRLFRDDFLHEYSPHLRHACVRWLAAMWLPDRELVLEPNPAALLPEQTHCTRTGQVLGDRPDARTIFHLNRDAVPLRPSTTDHRPPTNTRQRVRDLLRLDETLLAAPIRPRISETRCEYAGKVLDFFFYSDPEVIVAGQLYDPPRPQPGTPTLLCLSDDPAETVESLYRQTRWRDGRGESLCLADLRGQRGLALYDPAQPGSAWDIYQVAQNLQMMETSIPAQRVFDTLRLARFLRETLSRDPVGLYARGARSAFYALLAAALDERLRPVLLEGSLTSFADLVATRFYDRRRFDEEMLIEGLLSHCDIPDLMQCVQSQALECFETRDASGRLA